MELIKNNFKFNNKFRFYFLLYFSFFISLIACSGDDSIDIDEQIVIDDPITVEEDYGTTLSQLQFLKSDNSQLSENIILQIKNNSVWNNLPINTNMESLVASFYTNSKTVTINGVEQISNVTPSDFSKELTYIVKGSEDKTQEYIINLDKFTGLPIVYLNTNGSTIDSTDEYLTGTIDIDGNYDYENLSNTPMEIRGRGNSTWYFHPKKPYQIKFDNKTEFLGMPQDKKWIFLAEHSDKTLLRNKIVFEMGYLSDLDWTPKSEFAEVFINNNYSGTYNITQKLEAGKNRIDIGDDGYLLEIDQFDRLEIDDVYFTTNSFLINIKEPKVEENSESYVYIRELIKAFETSLYSTSFKELTTGYANYIDVNSFVDWYLISEIVKNQDSKSFSSIYLNVKPGEKIKMGPLWDFDLAFGNVDYSDARYPEGFWIKDHKWYKRLFEDPNFVSKVKVRFAFYRANENFILDKIDNFAKQLHWAQEKNDAKWDTFGNYIWPNSVYLNTHQEEVNHLKNWYTKRMNWLDTALNSL